MSYCLEDLKNFIKPLENVSPVLCSNVSAADDLEDVIREITINSIEKMARVSLPHLRTEAPEVLDNILIELEGWLCWNEKLPDFQNEAEFIIWFDSMFIE